MLQNGLIIFTHASMTSVMTDFPVVNLLYLCSNISESPAYGVFVSQLIRYALVCSKYDDFLFRGSILVSKLLKKDILHRNIRLLLGKLNDRHRPCSQI